MLRYVTTGLEVVGSASLLGAGWLAFGAAGLLAALGGLCIGASYALSRGGA